MSSNDPGDRPLDDTPGAVVVVDTVEPAETPQGLTGLVQRIKRPRVAKPTTEPVQVPQDAIPRPPASTVPPVSLLPTALQPAVPDLPLPTRPSPASPLTQLNYVDSGIDEELAADDVAPVGRPVRSTTPARRRPRIRRVTRVVRHVDPWSVFKVALCFSVVLYGVVLTAGVLLWNVAYTTGTIDNIERFFESFGWSTFQFKGGELYHNAWIAGLFVALGLTGFVVLAATLFNLIADLVGGIRVTVLEEEVVERDPTQRRQTLRAAPAPPVIDPYDPEPLGPPLPEPTG